MSKIKSFFQKNKKPAVMSFIIAAMAAISSFVCFAAEDASLQDTFQTQISTIQSDVFGYIAIALPVGLAIFGAVIAIKKCIGFVRSLIGRG